MRVRLLAVAVLLVVVHAGVPDTAFGGWESLFGLRPSRYAALAARQDLRNQVVVATSGGRLSTIDRITILGNARHILTPDEYQSFKRALDKHWPAKKSSVKRSRNTTAQARSPVPKEADTPVGSSLVIPAGVTLPDN